LEFYAKEVDGLFPLLAHLTPPLVSTFNNTERLGSHSITKPSIKTRHKVRTLSLSFWDWNKEGNKGHSGK
jgi:hypothetical protein